MKYTRDNMKRSPLDYAMNVKSYDCIDVILENYFAMELETGDMDYWDIAECLALQPNKLLLIFENAVEELEVGVPNFGCIKNGKDLMFIESEY